MVSLRTTTYKRTIGDGKQLDSGLHHRFLQIGINQLSANLRTPIVGLCIIVRHTTLNKRDNKRIIFRFIFIMMQKQ